MAYRIGIDAGSKTIKLVVLDEAGELVYSVYMRHRANIVSTLTEVIHNFNWRFGEVDAFIAMTGSAAIEIARELGIPFVQEVIATTHAVRTYVPQADAAIELGGEDAKVIYLTGGTEQRMNASCAGGTGGFIDTIAYTLGVRSNQMSHLAFGSNTIYPIASRCAVFAQSDVRPLLNAGVRKNDIAASVFDAVVRQTLGGLACGRPIVGNVVFLGGPLEHMPYLVQAFSKTLNLSAQQSIKPKDAHLFTVRGAALLSEDAGKLTQEPVVMNTAELLERVKKLDTLENDLERLPALFESEEELAAFKERHAHVEFPRQRIFDAKGPLYLGIDAGSTTLKLAVINEDAELVYSAYEPIRGDLVETLKSELDTLYTRIKSPVYLPNSDPVVWIERACATGYGEELLRAAFGVDMGVVETAAHLRSAQHLCPDLDFLLDIGGQDMKALWLKHGIVSDATLNEACSSGCGAFIEGTAAALRSTKYKFADEALLAENPIDLGTKCTVFMNSRVKHAQKVGASISDIAAGVAYSVVKNAVQRIIGEDRMPKPGSRVMVQGGTFKSDAVLRAFELLCGIEVIRPVQADIMGAIGCALYARDAAHEITQDGDRVTSLISAEELSELKVTRSKINCTGCTNSCTLSLVTFDDESKRYFISDNKCERGLDELKRRAANDADKPLVTAASTSPDAPPNLIAAEQQLYAQFSDLEQQGSRGKIRIGLLNAMSQYAYQPFWHTLFARLGFSVAVPSSGCETNSPSTVWETVPSESVCYPAKVTHARYFSLCEKGCDATFMPICKRSYHCPVQTQYAQALASNVVSARDASELPTIISPALANYKPERFINDDASIDNLLDALNAFICAYDDEPAISHDELLTAIDAALNQQKQVNAKLESLTYDALQWLEADPARHGIVLAGRPYHMDEALLRGIDREISQLGFAVFGATGLNNLSRAQKGRRLEGAYPWIPAKRLVRLAGIVADNPQLDAVFLESFGCGYEALSLDEAKDVLDMAYKPCTILKIDDISDLAHIRIRLRTLAAGINMRERGLLAINEQPVTADMQENPSLVACRQETGADKAISLLKDINAQPLDVTDLEIARRCCTKDVCFTANALAARVIRILQENPNTETIELPRVCETCLTDAIPRIVERACGRTPNFTWVSWEEQEAPKPLSISADRPRIGIVGNPLICFEPFMNDGIVNMLEDLGCECVMPDPALVFDEDVRYIEQLKAFEEQGIRDVIYLLSFGCLKGHIGARGALRDLRNMFSNMQITVIDYDPESSALNRENRIRLAVDAAKNR